jgi:hypothetical protein
MDQRYEPHWNVYYRTSPDGGSTWSGETVLSTFVTGYTYIFVDGFRFPFGDYFDMDIDNKSHTQTARQGRMQGDVRHVLAKSETKPFGEPRRSSFSKISR